MPFLVLPDRCQFSAVEAVYSSSCVCFDLFLGHIFQFGKGVKLSMCEALNVRLY